MNERILYTNSEAVAYEMQCMEACEKAINDHIGLLTAKGIDPKRINTKNLKNFIDSEAEIFKENESAKIKAIIEQFGETALTDGWEQKVNEKVEKYKSELLDVLPKFSYENELYLKYFNVIDGKAVPNVDRAFFEKENSVFTDEETYQKHIQACELLNELMAHPENEFEAFTKLFYFNPETRELEINIQAYDENFDKYRFQEKREKEKKDYDYNERQRKQLERQQRQMKAGKGIFVDTTPDI